MSPDMIRRELDQFHHSVIALNQGLSSSGTQWADQQYESLSALIREVAGSSKQVVLSGERACGMLERFERIAEQGY